MWKDMEKVLEAEALASFQGLRQFFRLHLVEMLD
jgi:hypothetical protein